MGSLKKLQGYYPTTSKWLPIKVDANGKVVLSNIPLPTITNYISTLTADYTYTNTEANTGLTITVPSAVLDVNKIALVIAHLGIEASSTTAQRIENYLNIIGSNVAITDVWTVASIPYWTSDIQRITELVSGADRIIKVRGLNITNTSTTKLNKTWSYLQVAILGNA